MDSERESELEKQREKETGWIREGVGVMERAEGGSLVGGCVCVCVCEVLVAGDTPWLTHFTPGHRRPV